MVCVDVERSPLPVKPCVYLLETSPSTGHFYLWVVKKMDDPSLSGTVYCEKNNNENFDGYNKRKKK